MKIVLMHQTVTNHDAIGNDIEIMYHILNEKNKCKVFAENRLNDTVDYMEEEELISFLKDKNNLVIYHHSVYWEFGEKMLEQCKGKIIIRYHNITPPEFFEPYNEFHFAQCKKGREQTERLSQKFKDAFWMVDSYYNGEDIKNIAPEKIGVCPPFHKIQEWANGIPDELILKNLLVDKKINLLFVGRVAPNKGHLFLLDIVHYYCINFDKNIKLRVIGKFDDGLPGYNQKIQSTIEEYGIRDNIEFIGEIHDSTLISYYLGSDFFICASEHEGFCVPILEAQYFKLPIIAKTSSAVPETIGKNQIVLSDTAKKFAAAIALLNEKKEYYSFLQQEGEKNYKDRFSTEQIRKQFIKLLNNSVTNFNSKQAFFF